MLRPCVIRKERRGGREREGRVRDRKWEGDHDI